MFSRLTASLQPAPVASQRPVLYPADTSHRQGSKLRGIAKDSFAFTRPLIPLACHSRMERESLGFSPGLRTLPLPGTHAGAGTGPEHWPGTTPSSAEPPLSEFTQLKQPRVARSIPRLPSEARRCGPVRQRSSPPAHRPGSRRSPRAGSGCGGQTSTGHGWADPERRRCRPAAWRRRSGKRAVASSPLVAKVRSSGTRAALQGSASSVQDLGGYNSRFPRGCPLVVVGDRGRDR